MRKKTNYQINERYINKKKDKLLEKQTGRYIHLKQLVRTYIEMEKKLKAVEKNIKNIS